MSLCARSLFNHQAWRTRKYGQWRAQNGGHALVCSKTLTLECKKSLSAACENADPVSGKRSAYWTVYDALLKCACEEALQMVSLLSIASDDDLPFKLQVL